MKIRAILLLLMIFYDASLHWVKLLGKEALHPLYPYFPIFYNLLSYELFWTIYWTIGFIIILTLLGSGTTVKNKTEVHIHNDKKEQEDGR